VSTGPTRRELFATILPGVESIVEMPTTIRFTADHYRALPPNAPRMELLDGEYAMTPAPSPKHQAIVGNIFYQLTQYFLRQANGRAFVSPIDVYLGEADVPQPDVIALLKAHFDRISEDGIDGAPDLAVEVLSPSTSVADLTLKREIYRRGGIPEYWIVDPKAESLTLHRLQEASSPRVFGKGEALSSPLLPEFAPKVEELFA
jgi:Uma2 family endonuclease